MNIHTSISRIVGFILLSFLCGTGKAQEFSLGPVFGGNFTSITNLDASYKKGANAGISASWSFGKYLGLNMQVLASQKGIDYQVWEYDGKELKYYEGGVSLNYIDIPILFTTYMTPRKAKWRPRIYGGPSLNILNDKMEKPDDYLGKGLKPFELAVMAGAGINYRVTKRTQLSLDFRSFYGLNEMFYESPRVRYNHGRSILLGYHLILGKLY